MVGGVVSKPHVGRVNAPGTPLLAWCGEPIDWFAVKLSAGVEWPGGFCDACQAAFNRDGLEHDQVLRWDEFEGPTT